MKKHLIAIILSFLSVLYGAHAMDAMEEIRLLRDDELKKINYIKIHVWDPSSSGHTPGHASLEIIGFNPDSQQSTNYISMSKGKIVLNYSEDLEQQENQRPETFVLHCINGKNIRKYYNDKKELLFKDEKNNGFYVVLHLLKKAGAIEDLFPNRTFRNLPSAGWPSAAGVALGFGLYFSGYTLLAVGTEILSLGGYGGLQGYKYFFDEKDLYESNVTHNQLKSLLKKTCELQKKQYYYIAVWFPNGLPTGEQADALREKETLVEKES